MITIEVDTELRTEIDGEDLAYCTPFGAGGSLPRLGVPYTAPGKITWWWRRVPERVTISNCLIEIPALTISQIMNFDQPAATLHRGDNLEIFCVIEHLGDLP